MCAAQLINAILRMCVVLLFFVCLFLERRGGKKNY